MALSLVILADGPSADLTAHLGPAAPALYARMLSDTALVAQQLAGARLLVRHSPALPPAILEGLPQTAQVAPLRGTGSGAVTSALAEGLAEGGPAIVIGGDLPHLPLWRLRDAATHLARQADVVIGPADHGSWYLLGLGAAAAGLLSAMPGRGAPLKGILTAAGGGHVVHLLPPWFGVTTVADLAALAEALRTMPPEVAAATRALIETGQASRAVGG